jgi:hypothetical protein
VIECLRALVIRVLSQELATALASILPQNQVVDLEDMPNANATPTTIEGITITPMPLRRSNVSNGDVLTQKKAPGLDDRLSV